MQEGSQGLGIQVLVKSSFINVIGHSNKHYSENKYDELKHSSQRSGFYVHFLQGTQFEPHIVVTPQGSQTLVTVF